MFNRLIENQIKKKLYQKKVIILYGPRQIGKTTLVRKLLDNQKKYLWFDGEEARTREMFNQPTIDFLRQNFGDQKLIVIDEAQKIPNIGSTLKLFVDHLPHIQVIATGSSSFDLASKVSEPLTGRKYDFTLFPFSLEEISQNYSRFETGQQIPQLLQYGMYPEVYTSNKQNKEEILLNIYNTYLYKDVLNLSGYLDQSILYDLLKLLALQIGSEVSYHELGTILGIDLRTVKKYLQVLEKSFVIYILSAYSKNPRKEVGTKKKIYFWDTGIRNAIIQNLAPMDLRNDAVELWENFCIMERIKHLNYNKIYKQYYFWRSYSQKEVDWLELRNGQIQSMEFKYSPKKKPKIPKEFAGNYDVNSFQVINPENWLELIS
jgi:uncharacterized protein